jgi:hypothetical protein
MLQLSAFRSQHAHYLCTPGLLAWMQGDRTHQDCCRVRNASVAFSISRPQVACVLVVWVIRRVLISTTMDPECVSISVQQVGPSGTIRIIRRVLIYIHHDGRRCACVLHIKQCAAGQSEPALRVPHACHASHRPCKRTANRVFRLAFCSYDLHITSHSYVLFVLSSLVTMRERSAHLSVCRPLWLY